MAGILGIIIVIVILVMLIASKYMDIVVGILGTIGGIALYGWWNSDDAFETKLDLALESDFEILPDDIQTGIVILIAVSVILLVVGLVRGKKVQQQIVIVQQTPNGQVPQTPEQIAKQVGSGEINKAVKSATTTKAVKTEKKKIGKMLCPKCNQEIKEGVKFCTKCGANIEEAMKEEK